LTLPITHDPPHFPPHSTIIHPTTRAASKVFKGKDMLKGVAFPTCVSVNATVGHYCPLADDKAVLAAGDVAKVDLAAHIDGFVAVAAHSVVVGADGDVTGGDADLLAGAAQAMEAALRVVRPGKSSADLAPLLEKVAAAYGVRVVEGVQCHQLQQFTLNGEKAATNRLPAAGPDGTAPPKPADCTFGEAEAWAVDVVLSTGEGRSRVKDDRATTVFARDPAYAYNLKMKASRAVYNEVLKKAPSLPFALRSLATPGARMGLNECITHGLVIPYPVLHEKAEARTAQFKTTVLLMPNGSSDRLTNLPLQPLKTEKRIQDKELFAAVTASLKAPKKKKEAAAA
jgi:curved DNA binding protein